MNVARATLFFLVATLLAATTVWAQAPRQDAIWAKRSQRPITLNGVLSEPGWAVAESVVINMATDTGIPGSGWKYEGGILPSDPTRATLKFLVVGNQLYLGAVVRDKSIGGSIDFNRFDGLLMGLKNHSDPNAPKPTAEYFYSWWYPVEANPPQPQPVGYPPSFIGIWANLPAGSPRSAEQIANWDAVTVVHGQTNTDTSLDTDYTVEMRFNLTPMGYDVTQPEGDIIEWNVSIYDCDWQWPLNVNMLSYNRVWYQSPWGNTGWYDEVHIYARPDVTVESNNPLPTIQPELIVPNGAALAAPTMNGTLTEPVWSTLAYRFDMRYGDDALRQTYPGVGPYRAGQHQPTVNGSQAAILDPADATVRMFFRGDRLYLGFDVRDQVVQYHANFDRWDGFLVTLNERVQRGPDNELLGRRLSFQVSAAGTATPQDYLTTLVAAGDAQVSLALKSATTVDTLGTTADQGYTAEMWVDLTALGYPVGLGDGTLFLGVNYLDGDSFVPSSDSYGSRTWWFREYEGQCCPVWAYMAPSPPTDIALPEANLDGSILLGSYPNPAPRPTIRYALASSSQVTLEVFDVAGRLVERRLLGLQNAGLGEAAFGGKGRSAGVYVYRLNVNDPATGALRKTLSGRLVVVK
ncbi:MAG TPA: T9SS type A sorting domain-containing protein [Candidatus Krumholzibacteria bacterium]|nr:T9SS type A sorting domain-containing protein [Candidatus Krumholzibacteria bacterium]